MNDAPSNNDRLSAWWQLTRDGDTQAFGQIHRQLFPALYYYALKLLEDNELADDAVQDLFIKIWVKRAGIGELQNVKAYFFTALRHQVLNQLRNLRLRQLNIGRMLVPVLTVWAVISAPIPLPARQYPPKNVYFTEQ